MAEHDERSIEHGIDEKLKKLDKSLKIPEIPDAQSIFEKAEIKKTNTVPFKKYSKYVAAAAAVVLICAGVPVIADAIMGGLPEKAAEEPRANMFDIMGFSSDSTFEAETEPEAQVEDPCEALDETEVAVTEETDGKADETFRYSAKNALLEFFSTEAGEEQKEHNSSLQSSSSESTNNESIEEGEDVSFINEYLNKKRSIDITIDKESVSVILHDNAAGEEIIAAFWVEGIYEGSYLDGEYYIINLTKTVLPEDMDTGYYLPMAGDPINGTYFIPEESILVSDKITKGEINLVVEINIGTGEYQIYASLV